jgi:arylsulfatase A-like enzyme
MRMLLLTSLAAVALVAGWALCETPPAKKPNVLLIVADDMAWTDYDFMGHEHIQTPNLAKLAREGALFTNGYVPTSLCRASLATLLTGLYAHQHKICCNDPPKGTDRAEMLPFLKDAPTIPRLLGEKGGYVSLQTGKFWEGHYSNGGFTRGMTTKGRHGDEGLVIGRQTLQPIYDFIDDAGARPWFVWYAPMMPHQPHTPPAKYLERYTKAGLNERLAKYYAMCEWFDSTCGDLIGFLARKKLLDDTVVVYVADNGWIQSTGEVKPNEQFATRSKNTAYDGGVRTPIIVRWPGKVAAGKHAHLVSTLDVLPTILAACGVAKPANASGLDLVALAGGKEKARERVFGEIYLHDCVKVGEPRLSVTHRWVREGKWKLIVPTEAGKAVELFDVVSDPHEKANVAEKTPEVVGRLAKAVDAWWNPGK